VDALSRRRFLKLSAAAAAAGGLRRGAFAEGQAQRPLREFGYGQVTVTGARYRAQLENTHDVLMGMNTDSLMRPFRQMAGMPAPGEAMGGWYDYKADFNYRIVQKDGLAPGSNFGQWVSALSRYHATTGDAATRARVLELNRAYATTISPLYYQRHRFPAYSYDKLVCGLLDSHVLAGDRQAFPILKATTDVAAPNMPGRAVERYWSWRKGMDDSYTWDESYTLPENLFLAYKAGAGRRYRAMAEDYLEDWAFFDPLSRGENVMFNRHAYSTVNSLSSAMQAYLTLGSEKHLLAGENGFKFLQEQSYATGGWGPDEWLRKPEWDQLDGSLKSTHQSFETPCGAYAHMKLTRYLLRVTRDGRYGDSMERVILNTVLGALPLKSDGSAFYYADYNQKGKRAYSWHVWPCCSGTLPQVATDYGISAYFQEPGAVWVNLYLPSTLRWRQGGAQMEIAQGGTYPTGDAIELRVKASRPERFAMKLRIPAWCEAAAIRVNGSKVSAETTLGFATVSREWRDGDVVEMELPSKPRLEAISRAHPNTVAVMQGPLVLFAKTDVQPVVTRAQALAARKTGEAEWTMATEAEPLTLVPFTELGDAAYVTYLSVG
jgi:DUF1680 family protein